MHEAYLRLIDVDRARPWDGRHHFFAAAAEAMRRILIENARRKRTEKHGGRYRRSDLADVDRADDMPSGDLLALDKALRELEAVEPVKAGVVKLRYFAGLSIGATARVLGISPSTAKRHWIYARAWLFRAIEGTDPPPPPREISGEFEGP